MTWNFLRPTRWKLILSLIPFVFPFVQIAAWLDIEYGIIPVDFDVVSGPIFVLLIIETDIARPFAFMLESLPKFWSSGSLGPFPEGPLLPGSFTVAIIYSLLIYTIWSLLSLWINKRRHSSEKSKKFNT